MQYVTNDVFGILLIPECKQYSVSEIGIANGFETRTAFNPDLDYIVPYREPYQRIIRGIGADLHEIMHDAGFVNLNVEKWSDVREKCLDYITDWFEAQRKLPIVKEFCHTGYFTNYVNSLPKYVLVDVDRFDKLPKYISDKYNLDVGLIPELPADFYEHTVPYWEIDQLCTANKKVRTLIEDWCVLDLELSSTFVVDNLFIDA
jgi:hypothetical protein